MKNRLSWNGDCYDIEDFPVILSGDFKSVGYQRKKGTFADSFRRVGICALFPGLAAFLGDLELAGGSILASACTFSGLYSAACCKDYETSGECRRNGFAAGWPAHGISPVRAFVFCEYSAFVCILRSQVFVLQGAWKQQDTLYAFFAAVLFDTVKAAGGFWNHKICCQMEENMEKKVQAYFTVEAAMIMPLVIGAILFIIGCWFFQYDRCLLEQDMGILALRGSVVSAGGKENTAKQIQDWQSQIYKDKYVLWKQEEMEIKLEKNVVAVKGSGELQIPFTGAGILETAVWETQARYENHRVDPVLFVRSCRKIMEGE